MTQRFYRVNCRYPTVHCFSLTLLCNFIVLETFTERLQEAVESHNSRLCVGLDIDAQRIDPYKVVKVYLDLTILWTVDQCVLRTPE